MNLQPAIEEFCTDLLRVGINLVRVVDLRALRDEGVDLPDALDEYRCGVLLLSAGRGFWRPFAEFREKNLFYRDRLDPLDDYTERMVIAIANNHLLLEDGRLFFPFARETEHLPFMTLGIACGVGVKSRLSQLLHPEYGPWLAFRGMLAIPQSLKPDPPLYDFDPCTDCEAPCQTACPAGAVAVDGLDFPACAEHRQSSRPDPCEASCLARDACPYGRDHRYPGEQLRFHQRAVTRHWQHR